MTNLFVGGEDIEFGMVSAAPVTTAGKFDATMARCALKPAADIGFIHDYSAELAAYLAGNNKMWYGYRWEGGGGGFTFANNVVTFYRGGQPYFQVLQRGAANQCGARTYDAVGGATDYPASIIAQSASPTAHDFWIRIAVSGFIRWYIGGTLWWEYVGDTTLLGSAGTGAIMNRTIFGRANANGDSYFTEVMATTDDDSRIGKRLCTLVATADGANTAWGGGFADIDEIIEDTTDSINTNTAGLKESFVFSNLPGLSPGIIPQTVVISSKVQSQPGSPQNIKGLVRIAGVDYESTAKAAANVPSNVQFYFPQSPATAATWLDTEVNGAEFGHTAVA